MRFQAVWKLLCGAGRRVRTGRNYATLMGVLSGIYLLTFCHLFLATYGTAMSAVTALLLAAGLGIELGWKPARSDRNRISTLRRHGVLHLGIALAVCALPVLMQFSLNVAGQISLTVMAAPGRALLFQCLVAAVIVAPTIFWAAQLPGHLLQFLSDDVSANESTAMEANRRGVPVPHFLTQSARSTVTVKTAGGKRSKNGKPSLKNAVASRNKSVATPAGFVTNSERDPWAILGVRRLHQAWKTYRANRPTRSFPATVLCRYLFGITIGLLLDIFLIAPTLGVQGAALVAAAVSVAVFLGAIALSTRPVRLRTSTALPKADVESHLPAASRASRLVDGATVWGGVFVIGGMTAVLMQMVNQLAAAAAYLVYLQWAAVLMGVVFGLRRGLLVGAQRSRDGIVIGSVVVMGTAALTLLLFGRLIDLSLWMNAFVVDPWMMMASRGLLLAAVMLPVGYGWGRLATGSGIGLSKSTRGDKSRFAFPSLQAFAFAAGYLLSRWVLLSHWETSGVLVGFLWLMSGLVMVRWLAITRRGGQSELLEESKPVRHWQPRLACGVVVGLLVAATLFRTQYDPIRSARQLFATNVFVARMNGLDESMLSFLDEGRPVAAIDGHRGTLTVWRYRGVQLQLRENGVPKAIVSTDPNLCPHFSAEVMPAVLPLVMHEDPNRVLILGLSGGVPLTTTLSFPVQAVTCVESDSQLLQAVRKHVWSESKEDPDRDTRLQIVELEPAIAVACRGERYDVVISTPDQSVLLHSTPYFTRGFYSRIVGQLTDDGIFCQRFHQVDYGPMPLQTVVKSMQSEFSHVAAIEIAAGEMALLATNSDRGLSRGKLVDRFQAPHVRNVLARIGWDWAFPLNLTAYGTEGLKQFAAATPTKANTAANGAFAFGLPQEVMRWAPKWQELLTLLAPHGTRLLEAKGVKGNDPELLRRLGELAGKRKLLANYPDQWWAYRKALKLQLRERPRTLINPSAKGVGKQIHPEDRHRMRYLKDLATAAKNPSLDNILRVAEYTQSFDPMITYFAHHEVASLYARSKDNDPRAELWHRLHVVYYASPRERSVRDVASAMKLLTQHPEAVDHPSQRWDHLNAMMQILKSRWGTRGLIQPRSAQIMLNDIEECLTALDSSFDVMTGLHAAVGITEAQWEARKRVVERGLVQPLRAYRSQLLKHHLAERQQIKALLKQLEEDVEDPEPGNPMHPSPPTGQKIRRATN